ncbi:MAG: Ldh family oxidoreductase [Chloroflexi bacterium]|nr:Ldh family oxidoreductase [Chloroflexota bacterium]
MIVKTADELHDVVKRLLVAAGASERNADGVAEHLVLANLSGVDTHGVWHVPGYVEAMKSGELAATAWPEVLKETPNSALVSGNWTFGQVAAKFAMQLAIKKAADQRMAVVGLVQAHHVGRLGHFVEMAAGQQMVSMVWAGGYSEEAPAAVPFGGRQRVLHTNPISLGLPAGGETPMMFDFATTSVSGVKVVNAQRRHEQVPPGCIVDKDGNPTTNPDDFFSGGAHVAFGGHKGYALMMAAEFLGRIFVGADNYVEANRAGPVLRHQGVTLVVFRADLFQPFAEYAKSADEMERRVRAVPPAPGYKEVLVPGDPEARTRAARRRDGIPIADDVWQSLKDLGASLGVQNI